ncbi:524_t:CDS:1, partial [Cetraspora pellucida]
TFINSLILPSRKKEFTLPKIKFKSFIYPFGINENIKTPPLTIKSIRKLKDDEHKM